MADRIRFQNITKRFGAVAANDDISLSIEDNEVHCLLGENGSGKTTLMNILFGIYHADSGSILIDGKEAAIHSPRDAYRYGIGMVHQHFMLFNQNTVLENVIIGEERTRLFLNPNRQRAELQALIDQYGFQLDLDAKICDISVGAKQRVEILKILYRGLNVLIFDEATAVLTPQEARQLMNIIRNLQKQGKTIIYISHKLNEVQEIGDHVSVLRKGRLMRTFAREECTSDALAMEMVGRKLDESYERTSAPSEDVVLDLRDVMLRTGKKPVRFAVHANEIVGIAGVDGNGQMELEQMIMNIVPVLSGEIWLNGENITGLSTLERRMRGIAYIPSDRFRYGILPNESVEDNYLLGNFARKDFSNGFLINRKHLQEYSREITQAYDVRAQSTELPMRALSGGNQQKAVLAREMSQKPRFILAAQPTRGLDIGAISYIHSVLMDRRNEGCGVLLISTELSEIQQICDRIIVMFGGEVVADGPAESYTQQDLGLYMAGSRPERGDAV